MEWAVCKSQQGSVLTFWPPCGAFWWEFGSTLRWVKCHRWEERIETAYRMTGWWWFRVCVHHGPQKLALGLFPCVFLWHCNTPKPKEATDLFSTWKNSSACVSHSAYQCHSRALPPTAAKARVWSERSAWSVHPAVNTVSEHNMEQLIESKGIHTAQLQYGIVWMKCISNSFYISEEAALPVFADIKSSQNKLKESKSPRFLLFALSNRAENSLHFKGRP